MTTQIAPATPTTEKMPENPAESWAQHIIERNENKLAWERKPRLREEYGRLYTAIRKELAQSENLGGMIKPITLEIGSGMGNIKQWIPEAITSERDPSPDVDRTESAYQLNFPDSSLGNIIAMDVWHHLACPEAALDEWHRVLHNGGRVILMEPGPGSLLGNLVYGLFHHEPVGWETPFETKRVWDPTREEYFACQSSATRIFRRKEIPTLLCGWKVKTQQIPALAYLTTGGFSKPVIGPEWLATLIRWFEKPAALFPWLFTTRLLVVLEKQS